MPLLAAYWAHAWIWSVPPPPRSMKTCCCSAICWQTALACEGLYWSSWKTTWTFRPWITTGFPFAPFRGGGGPGWEPRLGGAGPPGGPPRSRRSGPLARERPGIGHRPPGASLPGPWPGASSGAPPQRCGDPAADGPRSSQDPPPRRGERGGRGRQGIRWSPDEAASALGVPRPDGLDHPARTRPTGRLQHHRSNRSHAQQAERDHQPHRWGKPRLGRSHRGRRGGARIGRLRGRTRRRRGPRAREVGRGDAAPAAERTGPGHARPPRVQASGGVRERILSRYEPEREDGPALGLVVLVDLGPIVVARGDLQVDLPGLGRPAFFDQAEEHHAVVGERVLRPGCGQIGEVERPSRCRGGRRRLALPLDAVALRILRPVREAFVLAAGEDVEDHAGLELRLGRVDRRLLVAVGAFLDLHDQPVDLGTGRHTPFRQVELDGAHPLVLSLEHGHRNGVGPLGGREPGSLRDRRHRR